MERGPQFFKTQEPHESEKAPIKEGVIPEKEAEAILAADKEEREKGGKFLEWIEKDEQEMSGGIFEKFNKAPKGFKRGIMILATAGIILAASGKKASAFERYGGYGGPKERVSSEFKKYGGVSSMPREQSRYEVGGNTYKDWQKIIYRGEKIDYNQKIADKLRFEAYKEYNEKCDEIQKEYERKKFDIMIGRAEGAADYFSRKQAYEDLEKWRDEELLKARIEWRLKVWAIEEEKEVRSQMERR